MNDLPSIGKMQRNLWLFGLVKIPMIAFCRPKIVVWDEQKVVIRIKRSRKTNNHLKSMYFGALMVGADLAAGMHAFAYSSTGNQKISLAFKSCSAQFLQRPETDVYFTAESGILVQEMIQKSMLSQQRVNEMITVYVSDESGQEVAVVTMELSLKVK